MVLLILPSHLSLVLPSVLLSGFAINYYYAFLLSPVLPTCLAHLILFHFTILTLFGEEYSILITVLHRYDVQLLPLRCMLLYWVPQDLWGLQKHSNIPFWQRRHNDTNYVIIGTFVFPNYLHKSRGWTSI
jgi:hypothetical protein